MRILGWLGIALLLNAPLPALDPLPEVQTWPGYKTWTLEADRPLVKLEGVMHDLRFNDRFSYEKALQALGIGKQKQGRGLAYPELIQPIQATAQFLGFERRKMAVLSAPIRGKHKWYAVLLRQEGAGEAYWRARQVFVFDTDPVEGFNQSFPDINGEEIRFWMVRHLGGSSIYGRSRVDSILRWDERGRLRQTWQENADTFMAARFQGQAVRLQQELVFKGDQTIRRTVSLKTYPWLKREEWEQYRSVDAPQVPPAQVQSAQESFAWNPVDFNFYGGEQELEKLVKANSPYVRREAARRLGEHLKSTHPQLEAAMLKDKDPYVRVQAALALAAIGDPDALPSLEKALFNWDEPDTMREAFEKAKADLEAIVASQPLPTPIPAPKKKPKKAAAVSNVGGGIPAPEAMPQVNQTR